MSNPVINPVAVDLSHYQSIYDVNAIKNAGIQAIIAKATEGPGINDSKYATFRKAATDAGMLFGAYHFARPGNQTAQAQHFLAVAQPDTNTEIFYDWEVPGISIDDAKRWFDTVAASINRLPVLYSYSAFTRELFGNRILPFWSMLRFWGAAYSSAPIWPAMWAQPWLWQFTGDGNGPTPHKIPGIAYTGPGIDVSSYAGTIDQLKAEWAGKTALPVGHLVTPPSYDTRWVQASLNKLGTQPPLVEDDELGPLTLSAIKQFQASQGLDPDGDVGPLTTAAILKALG